MIGATVMDDMDGVCDYGKNTNVGMLCMCA